MKKLTFGAIIAALCAAGYIGWDVFFSYCARNPSDAACQANPSPTPSPTATPTPTPVPTPTPTATPTPVPTPVPTPSPTPTVPPTPEPTPPPQSACPKKLAPGAYVWINNKPMGHGFDSTPRVHGDPEFCFLIHGVRIDDCHLEGWPRKNECEMELIGGCPRWEFTVDKEKVYACHDDREALASCDHFGTQPNQDDPATKTTGDSLQTLRGFEGRPLACGLQRDEFGPMAGFFTVAHGAAYVRSCAPIDPESKHCGPWNHFDH